MTDLEKLSSENEALKLENEDLQEQCNLLRSILFGKSSEKAITSMTEAHQPTGPGNLRPGAGGQAQAGGPPLLSAVRPPSGAETLSGAGGRGVSG